MLIVEILVFVIVLSFLVIIHELGHYFVARFFGVKIEEFGIGYPPRALSLFKKHGTLFSLNWIPFGGFVKLKGENGPDEETVAETKETKPDSKAASSKAQAQPSDAFYAKPKLPRLAILLAGVVVNFIFGILAFSIFYSVRGIPEIKDQPVITEIAEGSPAAAAGIQANTLVYGFEVNGQLQAVKNQQEVIDFVEDHRGQTVVIKTSGPCTEEGACAEMSQEFSTYIRREDEIPAGQGSLGLAFRTQVVPRFYPWYEMPFRGIAVGTEQSFFLIQLITKGIGELATGSIRGQVPKDVAGPIGIFDEARHVGALSGNVLDVLNFAGILSLNLAVMNLLPIPALDGGRALFIVFEALLGKKRIARAEGYLNYVTFALLLIITVLVTIRDITRIIQK